MTQTIQTGGDTTVTGSAVSGTAGNALATVDTIAIAAGNLADNVSEANMATGNGNNSTNSVGNHNNSSNDNTDGDNSNIFALAAAAAEGDDVWDILSGILTGNGNDNGHNRFVTDNNTILLGHQRQRQCQPADVGCGQQHQQPVEFVQPRDRWDRPQCRCDSRHRWKQHRRRCSDRRGQRQQHRRGSRRSTPRVPSAPTSVGPWERLWAARISAHRFR